MEIISVDGQRATTWVVGVVRLVPTGDSKTGRLHALLTVSNLCHCIDHSYFIQPLLMSLGFPKK